MKSETELDELDDDTTDAFKAGIIEKDCQRVSGSDNTVKNICLAEFAAWYTTKTIDQNDYQPSQLPENASFEMSSPLPFTRKYIYIYKDGSCCHWLQKLNVLETVGRNRRKFEPDSEVIGFLYIQI